MATQTFYVSLGPRRVSGLTHATLVGTAAGADVTITINTVTVTKASALLDACKVAAQSLP